ncbi:MAG TPA: bifunctional UDP-sugar hydrolase/5'-nucleotidase [Candidatus Saccharimonadales bacterium]|nr:bifunctional UDP-sugar hydrolase/5'-nucleotidase [Candidatus Saccharimonadales bacterium]
MRTPTFTPRAAHKLIIGLAAVLFTVVLAAAGARADRITLLHTNDTHSHLESFDNFHGGVHAPHTGGVARRATLVAAVRAEGQPVLLLDAGDVFQGTPYFNFYHGRLDYELMDRLHYDLGCLGNHDLDDGYAHFRELRGLRHFTVLAANVDAPVAGGGPAGPLGPPDTILTAGSHQVGVFGLTTERLLEIVSRSRNPGLEVHPAAPIARAEVHKLRAAGCDLVVALSHLGVDDDQALADSVDGIDLIVGGHSHTFLTEMRLVKHAGAANGWGGTGIVQTGCFGINLGRIDVDFDGARPVTARYRLVPADSTVAEDPGIVAFMAPYKAAVDSAMNVQVGEAAGDFRKDVPGPETALGDLVAEVVRQCSGADVGLVNWGGIRTPLAQGPIRASDVYTMLPFDNEVVRVEMSGAQLRELFDFIAGLGRRESGGRGAPAGGAARRAGVARGQIAGASFVEGAAGAESIQVGGAALDPARTYTVGTIDFLSSGGDGFEMLHRCKSSPVGNGVFLRDAMITYLKQKGTVTPATDGRLR